MSILFSVICCVFACYLFPYFTFFLHFYSYDTMASSVLRYYDSSHIIDSIRHNRYIDQIRSILRVDRIDLLVETCYYVVVAIDSNRIEQFEVDNFDRLNWLLTKYSQSTLAKTSIFDSDNDIIEIGPRLTFTTPYSNVLKLVY